MRLSDNVSQPLFLTNTFPRSMLRIAVPRYHQKLEELLSSFPAQVMVASAELLPDLIRSSKVDVAFVPYSKELERKFARRVIDQLPEWLVIQSDSITPENLILLDAFVLRLSTALKAKNKFMMRFLASPSDEQRLTKLLCDAFLADTFVLRNETTVRFEAIIELVAFYDIASSLREAGARQISLIPIEQYF